VAAWTGEGDLDPARLRSNTFAMEWPPRSGRRREFPEVDRAEWFPLAEARRRILKGQLGLLAALESRLSGGEGEA
jgi:predicted NUDIX family NTP pyrophosphohydrolase